MVLHRSHSLAGTIRNNRPSNPCYHRNHLSVAVSTRRTHLKITKHKAYNPHD